jgi:hypothetical protein
MYFGNSEMMALLKTNFSRIIIRCQEIARMQDLKPFTRDPLP